MRVAYNTTIPNPKYYDQETNRTDPTQPQMLRLVGESEVISWQPGGAVILIEETGEFYFIALQFLKAVK